MSEQVELNMDDLIPLMTRVCTVLDSNGMKPGPELALAFVALGTAIFRDTTMTSAEEGKETVESVAAAAWEGLPPLAQIEVKEEGEEDPNPTKAH